MTIKFDISENPNVGDNPTYLPAVSHCTTTQNVFTCNTYILFLPKLKGVLNNSRHDFQHYKFNTQSLTSHCHQTGNPGKIHRQVLHEPLLLVDPVQINLSNYLVWSLKT